MTRKRCNSHWVAIFLHSTLTCKDFLREHNEHSSNNFATSEMKENFGAFFALSILQVLKCISLLHSITIITRTVIALQLWDLLWTWLMNWKKSSCPARGTRNSNKRELYRLFDYVILYETRHGVNALSDKMRTIKGTGHIWSGWSTLFLSLFSSLLSSWYSTSRTKLLVESRQQLWSGQNWPDEISGKTDLLSAEAGDPYLLSSLSSDCPAGNTQTSIIAWLILQVRARRRG